MLRQALWSFREGIFHRAQTGSFVLHSFVLLSLGVSLVCFWFYFHEAGNLSMCFGCVSETVEHSQQENIKNKKIYLSENEFSRSQAQICTCLYNFFYSGPEVCSVTASSPRSATRDSLSLSSRDWQCCRIMQCLLVDVIWFTTKEVQLRGCSSRDKPNQTALAIRAG